MVDALPTESAFWRGLVQQQQIQTEVARKQDAAMNELWQRLGLPPTRSVL